jgi:hypothetical protein
MDKNQKLSQLGSVLCAVRICGGMMGWWRRWQWWCWWCCYCCHHHHCCGDSGGGGGVAVGGPVVIVVLEVVLNMAMLHWGGDENAKTKKEGGVYLIHCRSSFHHHPHCPVITRCYPLLLPCPLLLLLLLLLFCCCCGDGGGCC